VGWLGGTGDQSGVFRGGRVRGLVEQRFSGAAEAGHEQPDPAPPAAARAETPQGAAERAAGADLRFDIVDVFEEMPERLHTKDFIEETRPDMD
jgi:hypothetical protein